jgi:hypothetical protein
VRHSLYVGGLDVELAVRRRDLEIDDRRHARFALPVGGKRLAHRGNCALGRHHSAQHSFFDD